MSTLLVRSNKSGGQKLVREEVARKEHGKAEIGTKIRRKTVAENKCKQLIIRRTRYGGSEERT